jgi:drug/metabolite transporter (DMT)-like permease
MQTPQLAIIWLILASLGLFIMVFGIRYLMSRENLAMIEKGLNPKDKIYRPAPYNNLKWGLLLLGAGVGLALSYFITQYMLHDTENPALWFAFIAIGGGAGLIASYWVEKKELTPPSALKGES